jgi:6-phosphogluconolactonase (cycloisomerase 2 family)
MLFGTVFLLAACGGTNHSSAPELVSIAVTPSSASVSVGSTKQFTAMGVYADNSTKNLTSTVLWSSSSAIASISNSPASQGLASVGAVGSTSITATLNGVTSPAAILATPEYVYITNGGDGSISVFSIGAGGALTRTSRIGTGADHSGSVAVDPTYHYAYAAGSIDILSEFSIGPNGALTVIGTVSSGGGTSISADPTGRFVYVASFTAGIVSSFSIAADGTLALVGSVVIGNAGHSEAPFVAVEPTGRYAYAGEYIDGTIAEFSIGTNGALSLLGTVPTGEGSVGPSPIWLATDPMGHYAYVANYGQGTVSAFSIGTTGTLAPIGTVVSGSGGPSSTTPLGSEPSCIAIEPGGHFAYVTNQIDGTITAFSIGATGQLTSLGEVASGSGANSVPVAVAVDPTGRYAYAANYKDGTVSAFSIATDGTLALIGTVTTGTYGALNLPTSIVATF